jgi:hypothetical protein
MTTSTLFHKLTICILAGIITMYALLEVSRLFIGVWIDSLAFLPFVTFIIALGYAVIWHRRQKLQQTDSTSIFSSLHNIICYFICLDLSMFAWRKIFLLQLHAPLALLDKPLGILSGEQLIIGFFSHSYPLTICIALLQLAGSFFLLFRKTRLLGVFTLLPVTVNILLLDIFYDVEAGALLQVLFITLGLFYLLFFDYEKVMRFFFSEGRDGAFIFRNTVLKNTLRTSAVLIPLVLCISLYDYPNRHPDITGKFRVAKQMINGKTYNTVNCSDSLLTLVYFDDKNTIVFERNSPQNWLVGDFKYNKATRNMKVIWRYPKGFHDTLTATLSTLDKNRMTLSGIMKKETLRIELEKLK